MKLKRQIGPAFREGNSGKARTKNGVETLVKGIVDDNTMEK